MKPFAGGRLRDANLAIRYLLQFDNILPDPGVRKIEEVEEIVNVVNGSWELAFEDRQRMEKIRSEVGTKFCHWCEYCMPCPQNVNISVLMNARTIGNYSERRFRDNRGC
jgi:predicted aldo/keto reductase-like oxidoreductase